MTRIERVLNYSKVQYLEVSDAACERLGLPIDETIDFDKLEEQCTSDKFIDRENDKELNTEEEEANDLYSKLADIFQQTKKLCSSDWYYYNEVKDFLKEGYYLEGKYLNLNLWDSYDGDYFQAINE